LPNYEAALTPGYQVELQLNNSAVKELRNATDENSAKLRFNFVDSATRLDAI
jgi:hypothetical protein